MLYRKYSMSIVHMIIKRDETNAPYKNECIPITVYNKVKIGNQKTAPQ